ncbi:MAG: DUF2779 domain-containing protein [Clostridia bacterium]
MDNVYLSKSKYCRAKQCNKMLWLDKNKPEEAMPLNKESVFETGTRVGELAKNYFGEYVDIKFNNDLSKMVDRTQMELKKIPNIITEASFNYNNNFCSVDILKNDIDGFEIYEVKSSCEVSEIYLDDISYQVYVLLNLGYNVKKASIMYINSKYVRQGELDLKQLFNIEDVTEIVYDKQKEIKDKIEEINIYMQSKKEPDEKIGMQCFEPYECAYWKYCTRDLPEKNVFSISRMCKRKKFDLYNKGIFCYDELAKENIKEKFKEQVMVELTNEKIIKKEDIKEFLNTLTYPLYFLDFETFQQAIPEYDGIRPYMKIPFQYSLHYIEKENGELKHKEYLAQVGFDPRRELAEHLVRDIPQDVCVTAYNMGFEKSVIRELAEQFEDLSEKLMNIHNNIKDLMTPFQKRWYYIKEMEGSYSIKYVLPALFPNDANLDYHNLPVVHNGDEASSTFATLGEKTKEEQEIIRNGLLKYCELDTLAMVKVWEKLKEVTKD